MSPYSENPIVTRVSILLSSSEIKSVYVAVFDAVFNEHVGFGVSFSLDGLSGWTPGQMVNVPLGCRTPLGITPLPSESGENTYVLHFTRRHPACNADDAGGNAKTPQQDN